MTTLDATATAAAVAALGPRLIGHGVTYGDYQRVAASIAAWDDWLPSWVSVAEEHLDVAARAVADGHRRTAAEAFVRASIYLHFAAFLSTEDADRYRQVTEQSVAASRAGMASLDSTFVRVETSFVGGSIAANVRRPRAMPTATTGRHPFVLIVPGLDSTKEEFPVWEAAFLARGLATVAMDGPGQGESGFSTPIRHDYEIPVRALLDHLADRVDLELDPDRAAIVGVGMGGYYAARTAAFEHRLRAVGIVGGPYRFAKMPPLVRAKFLFSAKTTDLDAARDLADRFTLDGVAERIRQPLLAIHGAGDAVMTPAEIERHVRAAPQGELVVYANGNTACQSIGHLVRPRLADWVAGHLRLDPEARLD